MAQERRQPSDSRLNSNYVDGGGGGGDSSSSNNNNNVEDITDRLDQMNVDTDMSQQSCVNIVSFLEADHQLKNTNNDYERMSVDDENYQPDQLGSAGSNKQHRTKRSESNILIVTNVDPSVFSDLIVKAKFESLFTAYDERVLFRYLKSFRRVRLDFTSAKAADMARLNLNNYKLGNTVFKCYLAQMIRPIGSGGSDGSGNSSRNLNCNDGYNRDEDEDGDRDASMYSSDQQQQNNFYLSIPKPSKQFLISPPVSPPAGWKPHDESSPCIDVQLISAIANLVPGQVHEIHPGNDSQPGIFVEVCEDNHYDSPAANNRTKIPKTANPIAAARKAIGQAMKSS